VSVRRVDLYKERIGLITKKFEGEELTAAEQKRLDEIGRELDAEEMGGLRCSEWEEILRHQESLGEQVTSAVLWLEKLKADG
jgi:hypothetical protein